MCQHFYQKFRFVWLFFYGHKKKIPTDSLVPTALWIQREKKTHARNTQYIMSRKMFMFCFVLFLCQLAGLIDKHERRKKKTQLPQTSITCNACDKFEKLTEVVCRMNHRSNESRK